MLRLPGWMASALSSWVADDLQESMKAFANANVKSMSPSELDARLGAITEMASLLNKALVEARAAKRAHV